MNYIYQPYYFMENKLKQMSIISQLLKIVLLVGLLLSSTGGIAKDFVYAQQQKFTFAFEKVSIKSIFQYIEAHSEFVFLYRNDLLDTSKEISIKAEEESIDQVLDQVLSGSFLMYKINDRQIVLMRAEKELAPQQSTKKPVKGTVTDANGEPVVGANILEKGTANGTITDVDGRFSLNVDDNAVLIVSYIGYETKEVGVTGDKPVSVELHEDSEALDEVVVIGYGTIKKKDLTGAVAAIKGDDLASRKTTNLSTALQGSTAGITVTRTNNAPGATASNIYVRGVTTISDSSPLVIVDGVPGDINQVSPDDVESVSVLKDAASASIYGSRAAAGVILVTTKRAKIDEVRMNYNFEYGMEKPTTLPAYVDVQRYLEMTNELRYNDNNAGGWYQTYSEEQVNNWIKRSKTDPDKYPNVDWRKLVLKDSAPRQTHSFNVAGGSKVVQTKVSLRYDKTDGLYANNSFERYMVRSNNDIKINKFLEAHADINLKFSDYRTPNANPLYYNVRMIPPVYADHWSDGRYGDVKDGMNILAMLHEGGSTKSKYYRVGGKVALDFKPVEGLRLSAVFSPTYNFTKMKKFVRKIPYTYADNANAVKGYVQGFYTTSLSETRDDDYNLTTQFLANYIKTFGEHDIIAMIGYEDFYQKWEYLGASRDQYELTNFPYLNLGPETYRDNSGSATEYAYRSIFGRLTYSFANRYLVQGNFRRDGSSRFASDNRWGNFPSFSAGWVISEEPFFKKMNAAWFDFLKLRASWGTLGNERIGSYYPYQAAIGFNNVLLLNGGDVSSLTAAAQAIYAVRNITWETTESWNIGFDAAFFKNRLTVGFDYYKKITKDMLLSLEIPKFVGYDNPSVNTGKMNTRGFDLQIGWNDRVGDFHYSIGANLSDFVSKMGDLGGTQFLGSQVKMEGSEFDEWYGYVSDGLFLTEEDLANSPKLNNNIKVGDVKYKDISGPDGVPDGKISSEYDRVLLGGALPRYTFGFNFNGTWKGFDLSIVLQGVGKQNALKSNIMTQGLMENWLTFPDLIDGKYWSVNKTDVENAKAKYPRLTYSNANSNYAMSDYWLFNGRYLRVKNLTLGYTFPSEWAKKIYMDAVRFYVSGNDLFCLSSYPDGWDPEVSTSGYPITKSLLFGISVNF